MIAQSLRPLEEQIQRKDGVAMTAWVFCYCYSNLSFIEPGTILNSYLHVQIILTLLLFLLQESLTTLLTDEEMQQLIENFDRLDVNQGNV